MHIPWLLIDTDQVISLGGENRVGPHSRVERVLALYFAELDLSLEHDRSLFFCAVWTHALILVEHGALLVAESRWVLDSAESVALQDVIQRLFGGGTPFELLGRSRNKIL